MVRCMDCLHCTYDGLCLVEGKWTLIDIEHDCRTFARKAVEGRTGELEQLCRDLFFFVAPQYRYAPVSKDFENRMNALGLLEVER